MPQNFKVGDKVRITGKEGNSAIGAVVGSIAEIISGFDGSDYKVKYDSGGGVANTRGWIAHYNLEHASPKPTKKQRITTLESEVAELKAKVEALENAQSKPKYTLDGLLSQVKPTPNEQRKAIIAEAKAFYTDTLNEYQLSDEEVIVIGNDKERSISVTIRHIFSLKPLLSGKSKCAPDDVFNADIGKAIALGRALGLDVSKFEQAVKPTEVVVGHAILGTNIHGKHFVYNSVDKVENGKIWQGNSFCRVDGEKEIGGLVKNPVILDDTEAQY